jgi:hypothetical protein
LEQATAIHNLYETRLQRMRRLEDWVVRQDGVRLICSLEAVEEFIATGWWPIDTRVKGTVPVQDPAMRRAWVENVIRLLKEHPRKFRLALVDRQTPSLLGRADWKIVGDRCLFFTVGASTSRTRAFGHSFDPGVVATFKDIFDDVWEALPQSARDNKSVVSRLGHVLKRQGRPSIRLGRQPVSPAEGPRGRRP